MLNEPEMKKKIIVYLINLENNCNYPLKQKELLISNIIEAFDAIYEKYDNKTELMSFVRGKTTSGSPKTRKKAKEFVLKYKGNHSA
jgi:GTP1/Obg family GTP-binding protein